MIINAVALEHESKACSAIIHWMQTWMSQRIILFVKVMEIHNLEHCEDLLMRESILLTEAFHRVPQVNNRLWSAQEGRRNLRP